MVFCGVGGVEPQSETVWRQADRYGVPRIAFVNKMDRVGSNFFDTVTQMHKKLGANAAAVQIPFYQGDDLAGTIDLIEKKLVLYKGALNEALDIEEIPAELLAETDKARDILIEKLAEADEKIMDSFVRGARKSALPI